MDGGFPLSNNVLSIQCCVSPADVLLTKVLDDGVAAYHAERISLRCMLLGARMPAGGRILEQKGVAHHASVHIPQNTPHGIEEYAAWRRDAGRGHRRHAHVASCLSHPQESKGPHKGAPFPTSQAHLVMQLCD